MPIIDFEANDGEILSVHVGLNEPKEAYQTQIRKEDGKVFKRIWAAPRFAKDITVGDASRGDLDRLIDGKNYTLGEVWKRSEELSQKRAEKHGGLDPVKEKFYEEYEKKNRAKHADVLKRNRQKVINDLHKDWGVKIEF
jgi:hypothetical protein